MKPIICIRPTNHVATRFRAECRLAGKLYGQRFGVDVAFGDPMLGDPEVVMAEDVSVEGSLVGGPRFAAGDISGQVWVFSTMPDDFSLSSTDTIKRSPALNAPSSQGECRDYLPLTEHRVDGCAPMPALWQRAAHPVFELLAVIHGARAGAAHEQFAGEERAK